MARTLDLSSNQISSDDRSQLTNISAVRNLRTYRNFRDVFEAFFRKVRGRGIAFVIQSTLEYVSASLLHHVLPTS